MSGTTPKPTRFTTQGGRIIYQLPLRAFENFMVYAYWVSIPDDPLGPLQVLIDTGSGFGDSNPDLLANLEIIDQELPSRVSVETLTHILITHGHIDHFGGLPFLQKHSTARVGIHELDIRTIIHFEERLEVTSRRLDAFLREAGVKDEDRSAMLRTYRRSKLSFSSSRIDFTYEKEGMRLGPFEFFHIPGHCPGQVAIRLEDILFVGDQVLSSITPHQSPESLTCYTGLGHYLSSLEALRGWMGAIRLALPGHEEIISDLDQRAREISEFHQHRLASIQTLCREPHTTAEISHLLFGEVQGYYGYNQLLALEEAGAHVEYLYQRGYLKIANLEAITNSNPQEPIYYICSG